jgi:hypothetical protein
LALQFVPIAPRFPIPGIAEIGKGSTYGNHFICSTDFAPLAILFFVVNISVITIILA